METKALKEIEATYSQRFTSMVIKEFSREIGKMEMTPYQERLAQHMFIAIDAQLKNLEAKRNDNQGLPIAWPNINMTKLAIDAVHRVELGLDALIPNHIHPIPYYNKHLKKYDLDLRIGYVGKDCYKRKMSLETPLQIIYELVYSTDHFKPIKKNITNQTESYEFEIVKPFNRETVIGGFGYIIYEESKKNKLVIVSKSSFDKSMKKAQSDKFWGPYIEEMQYKTLVHRVTSYLQVDPEKVNASYMKVEMEDIETMSVINVKEEDNEDLIKQFDASIPKDTDQEQLHIFLKLCVQADDEAETIEDIKILAAQQLDNFWKQFHKREDSQKKPDPKKSTLSEQEQAIYDGWIGIRKPENIRKQEKISQPDMPSWSQELRKEWSDKWLRIMREPYEFGAEPQEEEVPIEEQGDKPELTPGTEIEESPNPLIMLNCPQTGEKVNVEYCEKECPNRENATGSIICISYLKYMENING